VRLPKLPVRAPRIGEHGDARNSPSLGSFPRMSEPLPVIMENSIQIAWDYLERTGNLGDPEVASKVLLESVEAMVRRGEHRVLMLSNTAISDYKRLCADCSLELVT